MLQQYRTHRKQKRFNLFSTFFSTFHIKLARHVQEIYNQGHGCFYHLLFIPCLSRRLCDKPQQLVFLFPKSENQRESFTGWIHRGAYHLFFVVSPASRKMAIRSYSRLFDRYFLPLISIGTPLQSEKVIQPRIEIYNFSFCDAVIQV